MRKFKVVKKWPGGPEVGTILSNYDVYANFYSAYGSNERSWHIDELTAEYIEEIKEPDEFWVLDRSGVPMPSTLDTIFNIVPNWLRFRTKSSAEQFAKVLKDSHPHTFHGSCREFYELCEALNDRVK